MEKLFENKDFILSSTGHDYDFVGIIETKTAKPLTFFFSEEPCEPDESEEDEWDDYDSTVDENKTQLLGVHMGLKEYDSDTDDPDDDEEENTADLYRMANADVDMVNWMRTRDDGTTGFLSDPEGRGQFLALVKAYCPDKLNCLTWVEDGQSIL